MIDIAQWQHCILFAVLTYVLCQGDFEVVERATLNFTSAGSGSTVDDDVTDSVSSKTVSDPDSLKCYRRALIKLTLNGAGEYTYDIPTVDAIPATIEESSESHEERTVGQMPPFPRRLVIEDYVAELIDLMDTASEASSVTLSVTASAEELNGSEVDTGDAGLVLRNDRNQ